ncbi:STAS domain-containing protein [Streptomyces griseorubiginosus]|uniref:STAS domain-containing protein n=1 Tax=Streptomyces griseorubiginosus TaxID=67304 RepID=UPI0036822C56
MPLPQLHVHRHDHADRTLITLAGEIDLATAPLVRVALAACAHEGIRTVDVDLTAVTFCDAFGLNVFLAAFQQSAQARRVLRLHCPPPVMVRVIAITGSGFLLHEPHAVRPARKGAGAATGGGPARVSAHPAAPPDLGLR